MRSTHYVLTDRQLQAHAADFLQNQLKLKAVKRLCSPAVLLSVILYAAAWRLSLAHVCGLLRGAPCADTLHNALASQFADHSQLQQRLNRLLWASARRLAAHGRRPKRRGFPVAIDLTLIPYYGKEGSTPWIYHGKARQGTRRFHAYATAYAVWHGQRYTLALTCVRDKEPLADVVKRLRQLVAKTKLPVRYLLLDRGFYQVAVFRYLQAARTPFLMPAITRGRKPTATQPAGGTRRFLYCKKSGWYKYQVTERHGKQKATVSLAVQCRNHAGRKGKQGRYVWLFAFWGMNPASHRWVRQAYRPRFGIETSYRQMNEARARTSSRSAELRLLFVGVALVLRNLWVWWHWEVLAERRGRHRRLRSALLPLKALLERLAAICAQDFGGLKVIHLPQPPATKRQ